MFAALTVGALLRGRAGAPARASARAPRSPGSAVLRNWRLAAAFAVVPSLDRRSIAPRVARARDRRRAARLRRARGRGAGSRPGGRHAAAAARHPGCARDRRRGARDRVARGASREPLRAERRAISAWRCSPRRAATSARRSRRRSRTSPRTRGSRSPSSTRSRRPSSGGAWRSRAARSPSPSIADGTVLAKGTFNNLAQLESVLATAERRAERGAERGADGAWELPIGA